MKDKILGILNIITKVMLLLVVTAIGAISLATAYIMFAPDDFPKPFRLQYDYSNMTSTGQGAAEPVAEPTPTPHVYMPGEGKMINMTTKIINLADPTGRKYIRLTVTLEFEPPEEVTAAEGEAAEGGHGGEGATATPSVSAFDSYMEARMPVLDDAVITMVSTKSYEDLYTADGKEALRQELMQVIASRVSEYHLMNVYFTEFVVQ